MSESDMNLPVEIEPVVAYRSWNAMWPYYLSNLNGHDLWMPGQRVEARCIHHKEHDAPVRDCSCGIYALKNQEWAIIAGNVWGMVYLWGRIVEGPQGYRAQYAYPKELFVTQEQDDDFVALLQGVYGVPVTKSDKPSLGLSWQNYAPRVKPPTIAQLVAIATLSAAEPEIRKYARATAMQRLYMTIKNGERAVANLKETLVKKEAKLERDKRLRQELKG